MKDDRETNVDRGQQREQQGKKEERLEKVKLQTGYLK